MEKLMSGLKIAHLSDLHCDSSTKWDNNFSYIVVCLLAEKPNLIVITGDCVEHPKKKHFLHLRTSLDNLCSKIREKYQQHKFFVIAIPGNHDRYFWGNKLPWLGFRWNSFDKYQSELLYPSEFNDWKSITAEIFIRLGIALFPLDSNVKRRFSIRFAQGRIDEPYQQLEKDSEQFRKIATTRNINYESCTKIIILHHHPFPLPATSKDEKLEPYSIMLNAYQFLDAATSFNIDFILHGHRHVSAVMEVNLIPSKNSPMIICACGSSCKVGEKRDNELQIIESGDNGTYNLRVYKATGEKSDFHLKQQEVTLAPYEKMRKKCYTDYTLLPDSNDSCVAKIEAKTKVVNIQADGTALIRISLDDIEWKQGTKCVDIEIKYPIQADIGRIVVCWAGLDEHRSSELIQRTRPELDQYKNDRAFEPENYVLKIQPKKPLKTNVKAYCTIKYPLLNAYALDQNQHEETYDCWVEDSLEEACSIQADYPTILLKLIVKFPSKEFFPNQDSIYVESHKKPDSMNQKPDLSDLYVVRREYKHTILFDQQETTFLNEDHALSIFPEINEISLVIRYPQPNMIYTIRWTVPESSIPYRLEERSKRNLNRLRQTFIDSNKPALKKFFESICKDIADALSDNNLLFVLIGYDSMNKCLKVALEPPGFSGIQKIRVGRGAAGKAFKLGLPEYYEKCRSINAGIFERQIGTYFIEKLSPNFSPESLLALPLKYPYMLEKPKGGQRAGRAFAVLNIFANHNESSLERFNPEKSKERGGLDDKKREEHLGSLYSIIHDELTKNFSDIYSL